MTYEKGIYIKGKLIHYRFYENIEWTIDLAQKKLIEQLIKAGHKQGGLLNREGYWLLRE